MIIRITLINWLTQQANKYLLDMLWWSIWSTVFDGKILQIPQQTWSIPRLTTAIQM